MDIAFDLDNYLRGYQAIVTDSVFPGPIVFQKLFYITSALPTHALEASVKALELMREFGVPSVYYSYFKSTILQKLSSTDDLSSYNIDSISTLTTDKFFRNLVTDVTTKTKDASDYLQSINNQLQEVKEEKELDKLESVRRFIEFGTIMNHLFLQEYSKAQSLMAAYEKIPNTDFSFRNIEFDLYKQYMRLNFHSMASKYDSIQAVITRFFVKNIVVKKVASNLIKTDTKIQIFGSVEEQKSFWKINWIILFAKFKVGNYNGVKSGFLKLSNPEKYEYCRNPERSKEVYAQLNGLTALDVLNSEFDLNRNVILTSNDDFQTNFNFLTKRDILLAVLISLYQTTTPAEFTIKYLDTDLFEAFFFENPLIASFFQSLLSLTKISQIPKSLNQLEKNFMIPNSNFNNFTITIKSDNDKSLSKLKNYMLSTCSILLNTSEFDRFKLFVRYRTYLSYLSFIKKIKISDFSERLGGIDQNLILKELGNLIYILNINLKYNAEDQTVEFIGDKNYISMTELKKLDDQINEISETDKIYKSAVKIQSLAIDHFPDLELS
ncbi:uncharacterized protein ASCRUDRAFT_72277 [Ascoidea rubescens DSM 1968]|uniref:Uncharacterized protein n=1 Tax=Ascoidea rubescens DSM 1968 TaxID=1344418 RepID=A0A1D2VB86_9ASCO|nr:hypothetical protein ASCRUDRAFT_72277 [Ascoidea rubescens DSM 1968]ODV58869.1 hypothetical protein ASCRUDRAFT_72277 [Ascoidea rubescens DSM 1968]